MFFFFTGKQKCACTDKTDSHKLSQQKAYIRLTVSELEAFSEPYLLAALQWYKSPSRREESYNNNSCSSCINQGELLSELC